MSEMKDLTEGYVARPRFQKNVEKFRQKCLGFPMVKECTVTMTSFKGRKVGDDAYEVEAKGEVEIGGPLSTKLKLIAEGNGALNGATRMMTVKDVRVSNDPTGIMGQVLSWAGFSKGNTFEMKERDADWIVQHLSD